MNVSCSNSFAPGDIVWRCCLVWDWKTKKKLILSALVHSELRNWLFCGTWNARNEHFLPRNTRNRSEYISRNVLGTKFRSQPYPQIVPTLFKQYTKIFFWLRDRLCFHQLFFLPVYSEYSILRTPWYHFMFSHFKREDKPFRDTQ